MLEATPEDITEGPLLRALLLLAAPLLVQNLVQVAQQVIDIFFLGRLSGEAVAAVGLVTPVYALLLSAAVFAPFVGTQVLTAQQVGGDTLDGARRTVFTGLVLAALIGAGAGVLAYVGARPLLVAMTAIQPGEAAAVVPLGVAYLSVAAMGLPLIALADTTEAAFVGWGDSRAALYMNALALGVNILLDPLLIFGIGPFPRLEVAGAALATVLGYTGGFLFGLALVARGRNDWMLTRAAVVLDRGTARELLDIGVPTAAQQSTRQVVRIGIFAVVFAAGGAAGLAAYIIGARIAGIAFIPAGGLQQAAQSVVGQNLGAGHTGRASRTTWIGVGVAAGALAVVGALQWLVPVPLARVFAPELSADGLALTADYLRILAYGYPALGALYLFEAGFNGVGRTRVSFAATLIQYAAVRLPIAVGGALVLGFGVHAVFWAVTLSNLAAAVGLGAYYRYSVADGMLSRAADGTAAAAE